MNCLVSIIVPIYKVEKYLSKCLDSIASQTYTNIQVILVNDGSPDGCQIICEDYCRNDSRFFLICKENGGLASARNAALSKAEGDFVVCVDSDDWIEPNMVEVLLRNMVENNADMSVCSFFEDHVGGVKNDSFSKKIELLSQEEAVMRLITPGKFYGFAWNKMYKKTLLGMQRYDESIFKGEDSPFSLEYVLKCHKIVVQDIPLYHYRIDSVSISRSAFNEGKMTVLNSYQKMIDSLKEHGFPKVIIDMQKTQYAGKLLSLRTNVILSDKLKFLKQLEIIDEQMKMYEKLYLRSNFVDSKHKIAYFLGVHFKLFFEIFCKRFKG